MTMRRSLILMAITAFSTSTLAQDARSLSDGAPTFSRDVAPILYKQCVGCHRPGEAAPMSLLTYDQARPYAKAILNAVSKGSMPPWHADAPAGTFQNERILTAAERDVLTRWAAGGAPRGDDRDLPPAPKFSDGWVLGTPDLMLEMSEDYDVPAKGTVEYEWFYVPTNLIQPQWVQSIEVRPGNRALVHHILVFQRAKADPSRAQFARPNREHQPSGTRPGPRTAGRRPQRELGDMPSRLLATYAPGTNPQSAPAGTAFLLEPGSILEFQIHYTTNGTAGTDRSRIGFIFSKEPSPREVRAQQFYNATLKLPAGAPDVSVSTDLEFLQDATLWGIFPHTHLRGKRWQYMLELPSGERRQVLAVPRYDFNWQTYYLFSRPLDVPKGAKLVSTAWYDNSSANRSNPDPTKDVFWGDQTWEEMQYSGVLVSGR